MKLVMKGKRILKRKAIGTAKRMMTKQQKIDKTVANELKEVKKDLEDMKKKYDDLFDRYVSDRKRLQWLYMIMPTYRLLNSFLLCSTSRWHRNKGVGEVGGVFS